MERPRSLKKLTKDQHKQIRNKIDKFLSKCPVCNNDRFIYSDGISLINLQSSLKGMVLGGPRIPAIIVICNNCGHIMHFSLIKLGLEDIYIEK